MEGNNGSYSYIPLKSIALPCLPICQTACCLPDPLNSIVLSSYVYLRLHAVYLAFSSSLPVDAKTTMEGNNGSFTVGGSTDCVQWVLSVQCIQWKERY